MCFTDWCDFMILEVEWAWYSSTEFFFLISGVFFKLARNAISSSLAPAIFCVRTVLIQWIWAGFTVGNAAVVWLTMLHFLLLFIKTAVIMYCPRLHQMVKISRSMNEKDWANPILSIPTFKEIFCLYVQFSKLGWHRGCSY